MIGGLLIPVTACNGDADGPRPSAASTPTETTDSREGSGEDVQETDGLEQYLGSEERQKKLLESIESISARMQEACANGTVECSTDNLNMVIDPERAVRGVRVGDYHFRTYGLPDNDGIISNPDRISAGFMGDSASLPGGSPVSVDILVSPGEIATEVTDIINPGEVPPYTHRKTTVYHYPGHPVDARVESFLSTYNPNTPPKDPRAFYPEGYASSAKAAREADDYAAKAVVKMLESAGI